MKILLRISALLTAGLILAGCSGTKMGDYTGTERGLDWSVETLMGTTLNGRSTTYKHKTEKPLGTLSIAPNGAMDMTGPAVEVWARMMFCAEAPTSVDCSQGFQFD